MMTKETLSPVTHIAAPRDIQPGDIFPASPGSAEEYAMRTGKVLIIPDLTPRTRVTRKLIFSQ